MYHVLCWFIILFRLLSVIVTFYSEFQTVITSSVAVACFLPGRAKDLPTPLSVVAAAAACRKRRPITDVQWQQKICREKPQNSAMLPFL